MAQKKFQDLNLANAFLFAAAMSDPMFCRTVLEIILGRKVKRVTVRAEHSMLFSADYRSIRLDVYAMDAEGTQFNVEMQGENKGDLPKRSRFHQAEMDALGLWPGESFNELEPNYVIFICCFDPFGEGLYRYTFSNKCTENGMELGDETRKVFVSTKGTNVNEVPPVLVHFLRYVENSTGECVEVLGDDVVRFLHERVKRIKESREWERRYMRFEELLRDKFKEGREEGRESGLREGCDLERARMLTLIAKMTEAGEADKLSGLSEANFLDEMYCKYNL